MVFGLRLCLRDGCNRFPDVCDMRGILPCGIEAAVACCSLDQLMKEPELIDGAQVFAPQHSIDALRSLVPEGRPAIAVTYCSADQYIALIRDLKKPSMVGVASISQGLLKTARSLLAPAIGRRHTFQEFLLPPKRSLDLHGIDLTFCDSVALSWVKSRNKIHYRLVGSGCLNHLAAMVSGAK